MNRLRLAVVSATGTGRKRTIPALVASDSVQVSAIHGRDETKLKDLRSSFGIERSYTSLDQLIEERCFDFAMVCSPPHLHADQAIPLIEAGIPTLIEKPLAISVADAQAIQRAAEQHGTPVRIAHHLRHQNTFEAIVRALEDERLGTLHSASMEWSFALNPAAPSSLWKLDPNLNGQTCMSDAGVHCIDASIGLFRAGAVVAAASVLRGPRGTFEQCDLIVEHKSVSSFIRASRAYGPYMNSLTISGDSGFVDAPAFFTESSSAVVTIQSSKGTETVASDGVNPYGKEVESFARLIQGSNEGGTTTAEAVMACEMIAAVEHMLTATS